MPEIRCRLCGRLPDGDPEYAMKSFQHREAQKEGRVTGPLVYICPVCAGRSRYEAGTKPSRVAGALRPESRRMYNTEEFQALRREYIQGALERCSHLRAEAVRLRAGEDVDLKPLRQEIHKFRGSGGFYGFGALSTASGTAEDQLILTMDDEIERDDARLAVLVTLVVDAAEAAAKELGL